MTERVAKHPNMQWTGKAATNNIFYESINLNNPVGL